MTNTIKIGSRVRCNKGFAFAFEGQEGTITDVRTDGFGDELWIVTFDTPTPAATHWTPCKTLAATADCYDILTGDKTVDGPFTSTRESNAAAPLTPAEIEDMLIERRAFSD